MATVTECVAYSEHEDECSQLRYGLRRSLRIYATIAQYLDGQHVDYLTVHSIRARICVRGKGQRHGEESYMDEATTRDRLCRIRYSISQLTLYAGHECLAAGVCGIIAKRVSEGEVAF